MLTFFHCVKFKPLVILEREKNLRIHPGLKHNLEVYREVERKPDRNPVNRLTSHQKANVYRCKGQITSGRPEANKCLSEKCQKVGCYFSTFRANHVTPSVDHLQVHPDDTKAALEEETWFMSPTLKKKKKMTLFGKT